MSLIASISGIRGTIGGKVGENLTPVDIAKFTASYGTWLLSKGIGNKIVIGRDARISGQMVQQIVVATLNGMGIDVIDLGLTTTPTVEIAVPMENAAGGIIMTASHNPKQWNALKLLNEFGEFISEQDGKAILHLYQTGNFEFAEVDKLGTYQKNDTYLQKHIDLILADSLVNREAIAAANFSIVVDCVNSTGGVYVPELLKALGINKIQKLYCEPNGHFPHNPEPLKEHLHDICSEIKKGKFSCGIVVDPDVDRLALIDETGEMFGEEYTLVAVADYVLQHRLGATVSNLSSSRALADVTHRYGQSYTATAVGEVNVVQEMKRTNAVIGGEGNGGIIYPPLHYGRDAL
ncbi:MAG: phosphoglucosamine mutase, partial [Bacteroidia bacterium]|nr:phosphoglucosamine mutase [Bacteroidia bacterium]